jgi:hypothetical protein
VVVVSSLKVPDDMGKRYTHLGSDVRQAPAPLAQQPFSARLTMSEDGAESEVGYLQRSGCIEKHVFGLEITVADALFVDILEAPGELFEVKLCQVLGNANVRSLQSILVRGRR